MERVFYQKSKHEEEVERAEMEREYEILQKINKRKDALKRQERALRKESIKHEEKKNEKMEQSMRYEERCEEEKKNLAR